MENLHIKKFLSLDDVYIDLRRINIFIGPQAQGKSIITKLVYYFQGFQQWIQTAAMEGMGKREFDSGCCAKFESIFPSYAWANSDFEIEYSCEHYWIRLSRSCAKGRGKLKVSYHEVVGKALSSARAAIKKSKSTETDERGMFRINHFMEARGAIVNSLYSDFDGREYRIQTCYYIPAGRSFFANLQKSIFSFISVSAPIDFFLKEFGSLYERTKESNFFGFGAAKSSRNKSVEKLVEDLICGSYVFEKGQDWIVGKSGKIKLENSSSGQQEALPMALVLSTWPYMNNRSYSYNFAIEEPEAHLFPVAQGQVVALIASAYNSIVSSGSYTITTHSPYILTAFNNLIQAGNVLSKKPELKREVGSVVPAGQAIRYEDVSAYYVDGGKVKSIMDADLGLIDANAIDHVSDVFSSKFEKLIDMEVGG